jgi:TetR/AcrR family transcriptional regulator, repressor for uid operon
MELTQEAHDVNAESSLKLASLQGKRAENREVQAQRILEAAKKCFVRSGFRGASMQEICAEAGMSPGALYRYFPSKESIIEAISENNRREDMAFLAKIGSGPTIIDGFMNAAMAHIRHVHATGMGPLFTEIKTESMRNETVRRCCHQSEAQVIAAFSTFIEAATKQGLLNPIADIKTLIPVMMAVHEGLVFSDLPEQGVDADMLEPFLRTLAEAYLRPVAAKSPKPESRKKAH